MDDGFYDKIYLFVVSTEMHSFSRLMGPMGHNWPMGT